MGVLESIAYSLSQFSPSVKPVAIRFHPDTWQALREELGTDWIAYGNHDIEGPVRVLGLEVGPPLPSSGMGRYVIFAEAQPGLWRSAS